LRTAFVRRQFDRNSRSNAITLQDRAEPTIWAALWLHDRVARSGGDLLDRFLVAVMLARNVTNRLAVSQSS